ncbi:uncharacterized protein PG998_010109 [Apiospora kogelbergensis]|uniref:uncharacterized protein n=1 Tax=Apiospora kogelbergensis TaxID=1337665 RepID=UPI00312F00E2
MSEQGSLSSSSPGVTDSLSKINPLPADTGTQEADNNDGGINNIINNDDFIAALDAATGSLGEAEFNWAPSKDVGLFEPFTPSPGVYEAASQSFASKTTPFTFSSTAFQSNLSFPTPRAVSIHNILTIPRSPSNNNRSIIRRAKIKTGAQRVATLIYHTLKSYPLMMMRDNALPPFIHQQMASSDTGSESLHNCISLMHLHNSGLPGSRKLFWRNVRQECERLSKDPSKLGYVEIVAALQALSMYIIIRFGDEEAEEGDIDAMLTMTVIAMSVELNRANFGQDSAVSATSPESTWRHWMFVESGRRLCVLYQIVNMVVVFEPATMCDLEADGLILPTLPARKQLWEADTATKWMTEIERDLGAQTDYGMAVNGDLIKIRQTYGNEVAAYGSGVPSRQKADWEEWFSGMDSFGGLVMLAASLVG